MTKDWGTAKARQIALLMTSVDEAILSTGLLELASSIAFVDGARWPSSEPPLRGSIDSCTDREVLIWNRALSPNLPASALPDGTYQGPGSGPVVQFLRCVMDGDELRSGRIAAGYASDDEARATFVEQVWKLVKSTTTPVEGLTGIGLGHRLGADAMRWYLEAPGPNWAMFNPGHRLRDSAVTALYLRPRRTAGDSS